MASVETYAQIVERERYGRDVRQAIADGLRFVSKYTKKVIKITIYPSDWFIYDTKIDGIRNLNLYGANITVKGIMKDETVQLIKIQPVADADKSIYEDYDIKCVAQDSNLLMFRTKAYKEEKPSSKADIYVYTEILEPGVQGKNSVEYAEAIDTELSPDSGLPVANRTLYEKFRSCQKKSFIYVSDITNIFDLHDGLTVESGSLIKNMNTVHLNCTLVADHKDISAFTNILEFKQEMTKYGRIRPSAFTLLPSLVYSSPELNATEVGEIAKVGNYYSSAEIRKNGAACVLKVTFSTDTSYTQPPQSTWTTIATLPVGFRPASQIQVKESNTISSAATTQAAWLRVTTAGDVQVNNIIDSRIGLYFIVPFVVSSASVMPIMLETNGTTDGIFTNSNLKNVSTLKISAVWAIEEYVDYAFDNSIDVDISTILPDFVRDDVEFIIAEQNSEDGDPSEDPEPEPEPEPNE